MDRDIADPVVLEDIPFQVDVDRFVKRLKIEDQGDDAEMAHQLAADAERIARPRAVYRMAYIESKQSHSVVIDGMTFDSRVLRVNLEEAYRVFPFVATCGRELHDWMRSIDDMLGQFWADMLAEMAGHAAYDAFRKHLKQHHHPGHTSIMNPGSLQDWPIQQQAQLFELIGDVRGMIGVELTDSFLMVPTKSLSGICFPIEVDFENCQLCPRDPCPGRRAPYDPELFHSRYVDEATPGEH